jgi:hypothetical protein
VVAWPSSDQIADDFLNKKGPFKPEGEEDKGDEVKDEDEEEETNKEKDDAEEEDEAVEPPDPLSEDEMSLSSAARAEPRKAPKKHESGPGSESDAAPNFMLLAHSSPHRRGANVDAGAAVLAAEEASHHLSRQGARHGGREKTKSNGKGMVMVEETTEEKASRVAKMTQAKAAAEAAALAVLLPLPKVGDGDPLWQGVTLRGDRLNGSISGIVQLPRYDYFAIRLVVSGALRRHPHSSLGARLAEPVQGRDGVQRAEPSHGPVPARSGAPH